MAEPLANSSASLSDSIQIPGYAVICPIGQGGMASVYLAEQESLGRQVALKILEKFDDPEQAARFLEEGRILASLSHQNIITIHDVGTIGDRYFIAMEHLEGGSLVERIAAGMEPRAVLDIIETIGSCLDFVHRRGIIHRDVKPANIMFHTDGTPKLTDFGIAKQIQSEQTLTGEGSAIGSPYYLSPEQAQSRAFDGRSDVYALGIVFYEALTGHKPYAEESTVRTILAHLESPTPVLPAAFAPYQELLERMIAKDPEQRFDSAGEMVGFLKAVRLSTGLKGRKGATNPQNTGEWHVGGWLQRRASVRDMVIATVLASALSASAVWLQSDARQVSGDRSEAPLLAVESQLNEPLRGQPQTNARDPKQPAETAAVLKAPREPTLQTNHSADPQDAVVAAVQAKRGESERTSEPELFRASAIPKGVAPPGEDPVMLVEPLLLVDDESNFKRGANATGSDDADIALKDWLAAADRAMREYRLTTPAKNNAVYYYRKVLAVEPKHPVARQGMVAIAKIYAALAQRALNAKRIHNAEQYVARGLSVQPDNTKLRDLAKDLEDRKRQAELAALASDATDPQSAPDPADENRPVRNVESAPSHLSILDMVE